MSGERKLRFGVIGAGTFAEICHIPGLQSHPRAEVVALCGRRYDHARAMADRVGVADVHTDYRELCAREDLDGVTIATPNVSHAAPALTAIRHGKHVFCEKPLGMNVDEALEMASAADDGGKVHQVAFTFRYTYSVQDLRRRIQAGDIGPPYYLRIQYDSWVGLQSEWKVGWQVRPELAGGGMLFELGSHLFDIARFVLGPIDSVTGFVHNLPRQRVERGTGQPIEVATDDIAAAWFRYRSGVRGQWFASRATSPYTENGYIEVIGPEGALKASLSRGSVDILKVSRPDRPEWKEVPLSEKARDGKPHCLRLMMRSFVNACLRGEIDQNVDASFHDGLAAQRAIEAVLTANDHLTWVSLNGYEHERVRSDRFVRQQGSS